MAENEKRFRDSYEYRREEPERVPSDEEWYDDLMSEDGYDESEISKEIYQYWHEQPAYNTTDYEDVSIEDLPDQDSFHEDSGDLTSNTQEKEGTSDKSGMAAVVGVDENMKVEPNTSFKKKVGRPPRPRPTYRETLKRKAKEKAMEMELISAIENDDDDKVKELIQEQRTENIRSSFGQIALQYAANRNDFTTVKYLLSHGAPIFDGGCESFNDRAINQEVAATAPKTSRIMPYGTHSVNTRQDVFFEEQQLKIYSAISSPAYLSLVPKDPVIASLQLSKRLKLMSESKHCYDKLSYKHFNDKVGSFLVELVDLCKDSSEVEILLKGTASDIESKQGNCIRRCISKTSHKREHEWRVVTQAAECGQKSFIAHRKCQQKLREEWSRGQPSWHKHDGRGWTLLYFLHCVIIYGVLNIVGALLHTVLPPRPYFGFLTAPKSKCFFRIFSHVWFILSIIIAFCLSKAVSYNEIMVNFALVMITVWILSLILAEIQKIYIHGARYFSDFWNIYDVAMVFCYLVSMFSFFILFSDYYQSDSTSSRVMFAVLGVLLTVTSLRMIQFLYLTETFGPMLVTFSLMAAGIIKAFLLFAFTLFTFTIGMVFVYAGKVYAFTSVWNSIATLLWSAFGILDAEDVLHYHDGPLQAVDGGLYGYVNETRIIANGSSPASTDEKGVYSAFGGLLLAAFCLFAILILIYLVIAMIVDVYRRSKIGTRTRKSPPVKHLDMDKETHAKTEKPLLVKELHYRKLMEVLVHRYLRKKHVTEENLKTHQRNKACVSEQKSPIM
ncbi:short transient receptor potential channel 3-like isoform X2 [Ptychodera flava]|uniref:short transient receptor potential channel 3-like isoform X2 n=1 Tax=Ptychodera flava TaxID=63121 RepID=UPI00396A5F90